MTRKTLNTFRKLEMEPTTVAFGHFVTTKTIPTPADIRLFCHGGGGSGDYACVYRRAYTINIGRSNPMI